MAPLWVLYNHLTPLGRGHHIVSLSGLLRAASLVSVTASVWGNSGVYRAYLITHPPSLVTTDGRTRYATQARDTTANGNTQKMSEPR